MSHEEIIKLLEDIVKNLEEIQDETNLEARKQRNAFIRGMLKIALDTLKK